MTMVASNKLKPSKMKAPSEAKVLRQISIRKTVRKMRSIVWRRFSSMGKSSDKVRSKRMKTE